MKLVTGRLLEEKKKKSICIVHRCTVISGSKNVYCAKHKKQWVKETHPYLYYYDTLRTNAKRRKKLFDLTIDEFKEFCIRTNYLELKGLAGDSMTIDRIRDNEGYSKGNIQIMTRSDNIRKKIIDKRLRERYGNGLLAPAIDTSDIVKVVDIDPNEETLF